jgi:hypothetical protein
MRTLILALTLATCTVASADDFSWLVPLNDLGTAPYRLGLFGGLYEDGSNVMPPEHFAAGLAAASKIQPLDAEGRPSPDGKIAFLVVGFGETARITQAFQSIAAADRRVERDHMVILNAARDGADYRFWAERPDGMPRFNIVAADTLAPAGVSPQQVQAAWLQIINDKTGEYLGVANADAYRLKTHIAQTLREMKRQYPNLQIAYLSSRVYGGYAAPNGFNPEPYAFETGYSNRWVITDQIEQARMEHPEWHSDTRVGLIDYRRGIVPWVAWGPYLWANGAEAREDGLTWLRADFAADGETLAPSGAAKGAKLLFDFLLREPTAKSWFRSGIELPARQRPARH